MGCCGRGDDEDPRDEYEVYVKELKDQIETLDKEIKSREKEQKDLQREMEEIDPEREEQAGLGMLQLGLDIAQVSVMRPVQTAMVLAPDKIQDKPDEVWDHAEGTVVKIMTPVIAMIAKISDLFYIGFGVAFLLLAGFYLEQMPNAYGAAYNTMITMGVLMIITGLIGIQNVIRGSMGLETFQRLKRITWVRQKKKYDDYIRWKKKEENRMRKATKKYHKEQDEYETKLLPAYEKAYSEWESTAEAAKASGSKVPKAPARPSEPQEPTERRKRAVSDPGEEYLQPVKVKNGKVCKKDDPDGRWLRGDEDMIQDLKDQTELAGVRDQVVLTLQGTFAAKFLLFLMVLFVVTITFMLLYNVADPIAEATDLSMGPSVKYTCRTSEEGLLIEDDCIGEMPTQERYLELLDMQEDSEAAQRDFRLKFFQTEDTEKTGIGRGVCMHRLSCKTFTNRYGDLTGPYKPPADTDVFSDYAIDPSSGEFKSKDRQFQECSNMDQLFMATVWENEALEKASERYNTTTCNNLINFLSVRNDLENCEIASRPNIAEDCACAASATAAQIAAAAEALETERAQAACAACSGQYTAARNIKQGLAGTVDSAGNQCVEDNHACLVRVDQFDAVLMETGAAVELRDLCTDVCYNLGVSMAANYVTSEERAQQQRARNEAFAACHGCVHECKEEMNEALRDSVRPAAVAVWLTFLYTAIVWAWNNYALDAKEPPDPNKPRKHWSSFTWTIMTIAIVLNLITALLGVGMAVGVYLMKEDLEKNCPNGDCASTFLASSVVLAGVVLFFMGVMAAAIIFTNSNKYMVPVIQLAYLCITLGLLEVATLMSITTGDIPALDVHEIRENALQIMTHQDVCEKFDLTHICEMETNLYDANRCAEAPTQEDKDFWKTASCGANDDACRTYYDDLPAASGCVSEQDPETQRMVCSAACRCLDSHNLDPEEQKIALGECKEYITETYADHVEMFSYFLLTSIWYCLYSLYFNQEAVKAIQKTGESADYEKEVLLKKQFVQARVRVNQVQKLAVAGEEALYWALKCQECAELGECTVRNTTDGEKNEAEAEWDESVATRGVNRTTHCVGLEGKGNDEYSWKWPFYEGAIGGVHEGEEGEKNFKPAAGETMSAGAVLRNGELAKRMKMHPNYKRMCSRTEQEEDKFYLTNVMPEYGPDNVDWHLRENVAAIERWMREDQDDVKSGGAKGESEYYPRITALNYMITAASPDAHKKILQTQWRSNQAGEVKINHRGVGEKKPKKLVVPNISSYQLEIAETWAGMPMDADTAKYLRDVAEYYFAEAKRRLESPSVQFQTRMRPKYFPYDNAAKGWYQPGARGTSRTKIDKSTGLVQMDLIEAPWRKLDNKRFKFEIEPEFKNQETCFGLFTTVVHFDVDPTVGQDGIKEWRKVCMGLKGIRDEQIRMEKKRRRDLDEELRLQEEARLREMQSRADAAHEEEVERIEEQLRSDEITKKERKQLKKQQKQLRKADASERLANLQSKESDFDGGDASGDVEATVAFTNPLDGEVA